MNASYLIYVLENLNMLHLISIEQFERLLPFLQYQRIFSDRKLCNVLENINFDTF